MPPSDPWQQQRGGLGEPLDTSALPSSTPAGEIMDPQSLDVAVQNTLSGLYPPFDVTAPTVLSQLFRVLEAKYHGDGLCCLLDFLIPSKRLLEHVRQAACAPYFSCVFLHEGWPLCLHEKVVVHLGPLNPLLLRPGDFYLQAEPCGEQSASLVVKCLSRDLTTVEKIPIPEASCSLLFTKEWLEEVNQDLGRPTLHTCLVATSNGIVPVPWNKIATPEFVNIPKTESSMEPEPPGHPETYYVGSTRGTEGSISGGPQGGSDGSLRTPPGKYPGLIKVEQGSWKKSTLFVVPSLCDIISENLEGEYVNLLGFSEEGKLDSLSSPKVTTPALEDHPLKGLSAKAGRGLPWVNGGDGAAGEGWTCGKGQDSEEGPCTPCLRRKLNIDPAVHEPRCRYRDSYMAALKNPVSFGSGLMTAILEEIDLPNEASHPESPHVKPPGRPEQEEKAEEAAKVGPVKPSVENPAASNKFPFLKGHRQPSGSSPSPEKASKGPQEGPRRRTAAACSPRTSRAKMAAGKALEPSASASVEPPALKNTDAATENPPKDALPVGSGLQELAQWESLRPELLSSGIVCLPGNADKVGRPVVQITTSGRAWQAPWCSAEEVARLLLYLGSLSRKHSNDAGLVVIIDARREPLAASLPAALGSVQKASPGFIHTVLLLAEKEAAGHLEKLPGLQVELLSSLKALGRHVESSQLTAALEGQFPYCHSEWVQYFQKMQPFLGDLRKASELLQSTTQELEKGDAPGTLQEAQHQMDRHRHLMQEVLSNAQLVKLQREGGATLARLRKEAARLGLSPDVRHSMDGALALYNLVEEEVHTLVTRSNSRLEHLEFLLRIRELEAEFGKLSLWFDQDGESQLRKAESAGLGQEDIQEAHRRFKEFFKEASVHYNRGLSLSKEAAKVQGSRFPEMQVFEAAKRTFQAKLTMFYMDMESRGAELETLLDLHRFCGKVTQFNLDCKQCLAQESDGDKEPHSTNVQEDAKNFLQQLSEEFSMEIFQQMKIQASSLRSEKGLVVWNEALERRQEAKQMLEDTMVRFREAQEGDLEMRNNSFDSPPKGPGEVLSLSDAPAKAKEPEERLEGDRTNKEFLGEKSCLFGSPSPEDALSGRTDKVEEGREGSYLASPEVILDYGHLEAPDLPEEALGSHSTATPNSSGASPSPRQIPEACENLPSSEPSCTSMPVRGKRGRKRETAHYFQLSRHGSFSSEDTDSQNSTEDALSSSATLPMESAGPKGAWTQEKALGIPYLENHKQPV